MLEKELVLDPPIYLKTLLNYFQVPANHLLSASVMSAPAALAMSKLFYPETRKSKASEAAYNMPKGFVIVIFTQMFQTYQ